MMVRIAAIGVLVAALGAAAIARGDGTQIGPALVSWLSSLDAEQREALRYAADDDERFDLRLAPLGLEGLSGEAMDDAQWEAWLAALDTLLGPDGRRQLRQIMSLEREMERVDREGGFWRHWFGGWFRGERRYFASLYGDPGADDPWGLRFDGHHLSLNWTFVGDAGLSLTPLFLGSHPREVPAGWEREGLRALAEEEDRGIALWETLDDAGRARAELPFVAASGLGGGQRALFLGAGARVDPAAPVGVARAELGPEAQRALDALIDAYLDTFARDLADERRAAIDAAGRDEIRFAFAGAMRRGEPGYYRVQGPGFLIEFDNTARGADHVHAIYRDFDRDFGRDLLAEHHAKAHGAPFLLDSAGTTASATPSTETRSPRCAPHCSKPNASR